jgi:hypothetical protein
LNLSNIIFDFFKKIGYMELELHISTLRDKYAINITTMLILTNTQLEREREA